jgi:hypothetical protein
VLGEFHVTDIHMKDFAHFRGAFADGWKGEEPKRIAFLRSLVGVITRPSSLNSKNKANRLDEHFGRLSPTDDPAATVGEG